MPAGFHHRPVSANGRTFAKRMRQNATNAEATMWRLLRDRRLAGFKFRRQVPFQRFILDCVCFERKIVIEVDGSQHLDSLRDKERDSVLQREGFTVLRYWNNDVLQRPGSVLEDIFACLSHER